MNQFHCASAAAQSKIQAENGLDEWLRWWSRISSSRCGFRRQSVGGIAEKEEVIITRLGKPAGMLIGLADEEDWCDYCLENDPRFLRRIAAARKSLRAGRGLRLEEVL